MAVRRSLQLLAVLLTFAVAAQAFAAARGDLLVCRFTGKVVRGCPCPNAGNEPAKIAASSCCEVRAAPHWPPSRNEVVRQPERVQVALAPAAAPAPGVIRAGAPIGWTPPGASPPPRGRLFIQLRHLLI